MQVDDIPAAWEFKELGDVCGINPSKAEVRSYPDDLDVTFVPMAAVNEARGTIDSPDVRKLGQVRKGYTYFGEGDVLFAKITPCMENGKAAVARGLVNSLGFGSTEFHVLRPLAHVLPEWVFYWVRRPSFRDEAAASFTGSVGQQRVPEWFLAEHEIPVPPLDEQRRIVGRTDELARRVEEAKRLRHAAREEAGALLAAAADEIFGSPRAQAWPIQSLGDALEDIRYGTSTKASTSGVGVPVLRMGNIHDGQLLLDHLKYLELPAQELERLLLKRGDILVNRTNSPELVGKSAVFEEHGDYVFASYLIRVRLQLQKAEPRFVCAYVNSSRGRDHVASRRKQVTGQANINSRALRAMPIPLPPLDEQRHIVAYLDAVRAKADELRRLQDETQRELDALMPSVLDRAFRGEL